MIPWWKTVWRIINCAKTSTGYSGEAVSVRCSDGFKGLPLSKQQEINDLIENEQINTFTKYCGKPDSVDDLKQRAARLTPLILNNYQTSQPVTAAVRDAIMNLPTMSNVPGQDPATVNLVTPNVWIGPSEAAAIYGQKGLPETIINKKGKSPLLNGVRIKNPKLTPQQIDIINEDIVRSDFAVKVVVKGLLHSLIYGGGLMFPIFKNDSPVTMHLPMDTLLRYGIVGKGCVNYWVTLDRWNCVHIPNWNPCSADFEFPRHYYIPFLGAHVAGERCARVITAPQVGYYAMLMTLGWGISDIPGWLESVYNYHAVMAAIPTMIAQMSLIVRTLNVDSYLATEGWDILKDIDLVNTAKMREASPHNMINMDVVGDLKALQRDFGEVPNLVRLIRQDLGGRSEIPEEQLFSCERGAFSSGDSSSGAQEKQWEGVRELHRTVSSQLKNIAMIEVINALGKDREVLSALPYTTIEFDTPAILNPEKLSEIGKNFAEALFDTTGSGVPIDASIEIARSFAAEAFTVKSELLERLKQYQAKIDTREEEKHTKEMELLQAQVDLTKEQAAHVGDDTGTTGTTTGSTHKAGKSSGYTRMEQHRHEKTRGTGARRQGLQKLEGKKL